MSSKDGLPVGMTAEQAAAALPDLLVGALFPPRSFSGSSANAAGVRRRTFRTRFLPEHIYEYYSRQTATTLSSLPPGHVRYRDLPTEFINVLPLDRSLRAEAAGGPISSMTTGTFGYVSSMYKGISTEDGFAYAIRRVDGAKSNASLMDSVVTAWARVSHPSIVVLRRAFASGGGMNGGGGGGGGGNNALFFCHDFYPGAKTLREQYLDIRGPLIPEETLWSYTCQLVTGLRTAHEAGVSFRGLRAERILITGRNRLRIGGAGVTDVLEADSHKALDAARQLDMQGLGQILLQLATRSLNVSATPQTTAECMETVRVSYSPALYALVLVLIAKPLPANEVCRLLAPQLLAELDTAYDTADAMDELLAREAENGRLLRSLLKLGFINERPEHEGDPSWAETGDRYALKLFRDFLFHQVTDDGRPVLDVAHVIDSLNHLDIGSQTRVLLSSRDGASILVSSYASLRTSVNAAFDELRNSAVKGTPAATATTTISSSTAAATGLSSSAAAVGGVGENASSVDDADWLRRPRIPAVVRARTAPTLRAAGLRARNAGMLGSMGGIGGGVGNSAMMMGQGMMGAGMGGMMGGGMGGFEAMLGAAAAAGLATGGGGGNQGGWINSNNNNNNDIINTFQQTGVDYSSSSSTMTTAASGGGGGGGNMMLNTGMMMGGIGGGGQYVGDNGVYGTDNAGGYVDQGNGVYTDDGSGGNVYGDTAYDGGVDDGGQNYNNNINYGTTTTYGDGGGEGGDQQHQQLYVGAYNAPEFVPGGVDNSNNFNVNAREFKPTWGNG